MSWLSVFLPSLFTSDSAGPPTMREYMQAKYSGPRIGVQPAPFPEALISRLTILATGCKKHPAYRAIRQPRTPCSRCADMWAASRALASNGSSEG